MLSKLSAEMLIDLVENRISDPDVHEPAKRSEFSRLQAALAELTGLSSATPTIAAVRRGRPPKRQFAYA